MPYTGKAIKDNEPTVKIGETILTKNKDYKVQYQNNKDAGTAFVVITGKGEYKGRAVVSFQIVPENTQNVVILPIKDKTYNGKLQKPAVKVKAGKKTLKKNKDYTVRYKANLHAGTATVTITGKGNYTISAKQTFQIKKLDIKKVSVKGTKTEGLILTYKNRVLRENVDYTLEYGKTKGNKIEVVIHAAANSDFTGSVTKSVKVKDSKKAK